MAYSEKIQLVSLNVDRSIHPRHREVESLERYQPTPTSSPINIVKFTARSTAQIREHDYYSLWPPHAA